MRRCLLFVAAALVAAFAPASAAGEAPASADAAKLARIAAIRPSPRQLRWQQCELTAFFHFGMNTFTDAEWGDGKADPAKFNPADLDCDQWIRAIKAAGFKLAILTAKHHDGFCLWPSAYTDYSVKASPWKGGHGDVVREFVEACRRNGVRVGIYISPWDRHEPSYGSDRYNKYFASQLVELCRNYGPIDEFWFDGACGEGPNGKRQDYAWTAFYAVIRKHAPQAVIAVSGPDVRWVGNESGLARESEWSPVPVNAEDQDRVRKDFESFHFENVDPKKMAAMQAVRPEIAGGNRDLGSREKMLKADNWAWYPAECDVSIRPGWFYHKSQDGQVKGLDKLMDIYFKSVGRNSVLLLNIPPDRQGHLAAPDVARLAELGACLRATFGRRVPIRECRNRTLYFNGAATFDVVMLREDIANVGQRIEKFRLEAEKNGKWEPVAAATTVGYQRLIRLDRPVTTRALRLIVEEERAPARIAAFSVYRFATK